MGNNEGEGVCRLCAEHMLPLLETIVEESWGVREDVDPEHVHRMRVASRRTREGLAVFESCFPRKRYHYWRKEMRSITRALGAARDADVQIEFLQDWLGKVSDFRVPGIRLCLEEEERVRAELQVSLVDALEEMDDAGAVEAMRQYLTGLFADAYGSEEGSAALVLGGRSVRERITEMRSHEPYLKDEGALREHHEMRIAAKRLRYTLEAFRPLFGNGLKEEISSVKEIQEMLGEIHDMDVWVEYLDALLVESGSAHLLELLGGREAGPYLPGIHFLRGRCKGRRKARFREFVQMYDALMRGDFLLHVQDRFAYHGSSQPGDGVALVKELNDAPGTRIVVLGDVHANLHALEAVLRDAEKQGATKIIDTGDQVGYGALPDEVVALLRSKGALSVIGNYDLKVFRIHEKKGSWPGSKPSDKLLGFRWAYDHLSAGSREFLLSLPAEVRLEAAGRMILVTHGSPDSMDEYVGPMTSLDRLREIAETSEADILICGHSHTPFLRRVAGTTMLNPGSVGRQDDGDPRAAYALLTLEPLSIELRRVSYDVEAAAQAIREEGLPEAFAQMVIRGRSYDFVAGLEGSRLPKNKGERLQMVRKVASSYLGNDAHSEKVRQLALMIFEGVKTMFDLGRKERYWLECAAILHDVGWVEGRLGHHKASLRIILEEEDLPFQKMERRIVGLIARYHRKAPPSEEDAHYATLGEEERRSVDRLAAILRVADGLDATHSGTVASLRCQVNTDSIIIHLVVRGDAEMEERDASKKGDLLQKVTNRTLRIVREEPS